MNQLTRFFSIPIALLILVSCSGQSEKPLASENALENHTESINENDYRPEEVRSYDEFNTVTSEDKDLLADIEEEMTDTLEYEVDLNDKTPMDYQDEYEVSQEEIIVGEPTAWKDEEEPELVAKETEESRHEEEQLINLDENEVEVETEELISDEDSEEDPITVTEIDENYEDDDEPKSTQNDDSPSNNHAF